MPQPLNETIANLFQRSTPAFTKRLDTPRRRFFVCQRLYSSCHDPLRGGRVPAATSSWKFELSFITKTSEDTEIMKRSSTTSVVASTKKRKTDAGPKFYAVKAGFRPGVYTTYAECSAQTAGFKGAVFKSFPSKADAEAFVAGKYVATPAGPAKFYAVAVGSPTGIYSEWAEASEAITGVKGPKYKRFGSRAEAVAYIKEFGSKQAYEALGDVAEPANTTAKPAAKSKSSQSRIPDPPMDGVTRIYTDGSSLANGKKGSRAGVGVYFGDADSRNVSERLQGEPQTNQRAELMAMLRAMQVVPVKDTIEIFSDSQYSINCVTQWAENWKKKGWKTATGENVKNQDIIRVILDKMDERAKAGANTLFQWVKGHATDLGNVAADSLAVAGAKMAL